MIWLFVLLLMSTLDVSGWLYLVWIIAVLLKMIVLIWEDRP